MWLITINEPLCRRIREFMNLAKIIIILALPITEINNSRILDFTKSLEITNSRNFKHAKINRSTVFQYSTLQNRKFIFPQAADSEPK